MRKVSTLRRIIILLLSAIILLLLLIFLNIVISNRNLNNELSQVKEVQKILGSLIENDDTIPTVNPGDIDSEIIADQSIQKVDLSQEVLKLFNASNSSTIKNGDQAVTYVDNSVVVNELPTSLCDNDQILIKDNSGWVCIDYSSDPSTISIQPADGLINSGTEQNQIWEVDIDNDTLEISVGGIKVAHESINSEHIENGSLALVDLGDSGCEDGEVIKWNGGEWICEEDLIGEGLTEDEIEAYIFDGDNDGILSSGTLNLGLLSYIGTIKDENIANDLTISALGNVDDAALSDNVTLLGQTISKNELENSGVLSFDWTSGELASNVMLEGENLSLLNNDLGFLTDDTSILKNHLVNTGILAFDWTDDEISDALTISALGNVADEALSGNVSLLGQSITKDEIENDGALSFDWSSSELASNVMLEGENLSLLNNDLGWLSDDTVVLKNHLVNTGILPFDWNDSEISDALTISALGNIDDAALSNNVSLLGQEIDLDTETTGVLPLDKGGLGQALTVPNDDSLLFWDDSARAVNFLNLGTNLDIDNATINATDQFQGTVSNVVAGNGLQGGSITNTGTVSIDSETCTASDKLQWDGSAFICVDDTPVAYTAGNDVDVVTNVISVEPQLDSVTTISRAASNLTLQTTTSGNILLNPVGNVGIGEAVPGAKLDVAGTIQTDGFQLTATPALGKVLTSNATGVGSWQDLPVGSIYNLNVAKTGVKIWNGSGTTTSGVATLNLTDDGTAGGNALFTNVYSIQVSGSRNTATEADVPIAAVKALSGDRKTLTVNVVESRLVVIAQESLVFAPNGTTVYVTVIGD